MDLTPANYPTVITAGSIVLSDSAKPGNVSGSWSVNETRCNRNYSVKLKADISSKYIGFAQIASSIPVRIGDSYQYPLFSGSGPTENDTGSYLQSIEGEIEGWSQDGTARWGIILSYAPFNVQFLLGTSDINQGIINPTDAYPVVYWTEAKYKIHKPEDEGTPPLPYLNTVKDPLLDTPEIEETRPVLNVIMNRPQYNDAWASQYKDTVNLDDFLGYPPNCAKCAVHQGRADI